MENVYNRIHMSVNFMFSWNNIVMLGDKVLSFPMAQCVCTHSLLCHLLSIRIWKIKNKKKLAKSWNGHPQTFFFQFLFSNHFQCNNRNILYNSHQLAFIKVVCLLTKLLNKKRKKLKNKMNTKKTKNYGQSLMMIHTICFVCENLEY